MYGNYGTEIREHAPMIGMLRPAVSDARRFLKGKKLGKKIKQVKPKKLPNKMGKLPKKSREEEEKLWNEVSKKYISPYSKENRLKRLLDFVDDGQKPRENEFHPEFKKRNRMGRSDRWDKEERGDMRDGDPDEFDYENYDFKFDPTSKGKRQWHRNPHMKEEYEDQIEDLREDDLLIAEHKKGKFKLPTRLQPALAGDPMRIKKAKRQMQAKRC